MNKGKVFVAFTMAIQHDDFAGIVDDEGATDTRIDAFNRGDWSYVGVCAVAKVIIEYPSGNAIEYTLKSAGLWAVESDSSADYLNGIYQEEVAELKRDIEALRTWPLEYKDA